MDQVHVIRHKVLVEGRSRRQVAKELGISRLTIRKYLEEAAPRKETLVRPRPIWDAVRDRVDGLLAESGRWTGGKQQLTATRLHELLVTEGHRVGVTLVKEAVAEWKRQRREVFVPLTYRPGNLAEVDFFEVLVDLDGVRRKAWLFLMRLMYSGRDFAWIYERQDQISFLDGHVRAFAHFDGVPARVAYDNLRAAVVRILVGGARTLTPRFSALASHYLLEACFCRPGEGPRQGRRRVSRQGDPSEGTGPDSNRADAGDNQCDAARPHGCARRDHAGRGRPDNWRPLRGGAARVSVGPHPVCAGGDDAGDRDPARVGAPRGRGPLRPDALGRVGLVVRTGATSVTIVGREGTRIQHPRLRFGQRSIDYRHYLSELARKPQAVRQVLPDLLRDLGARFRRFGISSTRPTGPGTRHGCLRKCSASSRRRERTSSCRRCGPRSWPGRRCSWR